MKLHKRICLTIWCILFFSFISANINGEELTIFKGNYLSLGLLTGKQNVTLEIRFDTDNNMYYLFYYYIGLTQTPVWISLTENQLEILRNNLKKFIEWDTIARRENANISRELPNSAIDAVNVIEGTGYERAESRNLTNLLFRFDTDTQATKMAGEPLLLITSNKVGTRNAYGIVTLQVMINLTSEQAQNLLTGMEPNNLKNSINRLRGQSNLFN